MSSVKQPIYLDYNSTTPVDERVFMKMSPYFCSRFGNATSRIHVFGWDAQDAVEDARLEIAELIHAQSQEIIFTSSATESINLALKGFARRHSDRGRHLITTAVEHKAVLETCRFLEGSGWSVTYLPVESGGGLDLELLDINISDRTTMIAVMAANNEIGTVYPIAEIGRIARKYGICFFTDATQAVGKVDIDVVRDQVDMMAFSAHKVYGPKGTGALYVRNGVDIEAQMHGGSQERGIRSGTLNVPGIVGFGEACRILRTEGNMDAERVAQVRDLLESEILRRIPEVRVNGSRIDRLPNTTNLSFNFVESKDLMRMLHSVAVSAGSACATARSQPSHVLKTLGLNDDQILSSIRFSLGRFTTEDEILFTVEMLEEAVHDLRKQSLLWQMSHAGI